MATTSQPARSQAGRWIFARVAVGIDGSREALDAAEQAAVLQNIDGALTLLAVWETAPAATGGTGPDVPYYFDEERMRAVVETHLEAARSRVAACATASATLLHGAPAGMLLEEIDRQRSTLITIGCREQRRLLGALKGGVATEIIHRAPCSVLVARPAGDGVPRRVIVGVDGSPESAAAFAAAGAIADRFGMPLHAVVARGKGVVDELLANEITGGNHDSPSTAPAEALLARTSSTDLLVVGSRGLRGVRSLGSVSERVAHRARCSVLIVRSPAWRRVALELGREAE